MSINESGVIKSERRNIYQIKEEIGGCPDRLRELNIPNASAVSAACRIPSVDHDKAVKYIGDYLSRFAKHCMIVSLCDDISETEIVIVCSALTESSFTSYTFESTRLPL